MGHSAERLREKSATEAQYKAHPSTESKGTLPQRGHTFLPSSSPLRWWRVVAPHYAQMVSMSVVTNHLRQTGLGLRRDAMSCQSWLPRCSKRHGGKDHRPRLYRSSSSPRKKEIACWDPHVPDVSGSRRAVACLSSLEQGLETGPALPHSAVLCSIILSYPVQLRRGQPFWRRLWLHRNRGCGKEWLSRIGQLEISRLSNCFLPGREDRGKQEFKLLVANSSPLTHWLFWVPMRIHYCTKPSHGW